MFISKSVGYADRQIWVQSNVFTCLTPPKWCWQHCILYLYNCISIKFMCILCVAVYLQFRQKCLLSQYINVCILFDPVSYMYIHGLYLLKLRIVGRYFQKSDEFSVQYFVYEIYYILHNGSSDLNMNKMFVFVQV